MKKLIFITVVTGMIALLSGCLSTLHPLFTEKDLVFDPRLVGTWKEGSDGDGKIIIEQGSASSFGDLPANLQAVANKAYNLTIIDEDGETKYYSFLVRIGKNLYLDYYPADNARRKQYDEFFKQHLVKLHSLYRLDSLDSKSFVVSRFKESFLSDLISNKKIRISHEVLFDGSYLITASTEELQQYVLKYGDTPAAYQDEKGDHYFKVQ